MGGQTVWGLVLSTEGELPVPAIPATECDRQMQFDPREHEQFVTPLGGFQDWAAVRVGPDPMAWRVETVKDGNHHGYGYVRSDGVLTDIFERWSSTSFQFSLGKQTNPLGSRSGLWKQRREVDVLTVDPNEPWLTHLKLKVVTYHEASDIWQMRKLTPVNVEGGFLKPRSLPPYEGGTGKPSTCTQRVEPERDGLVQ